MVFQRVGNDWVTFTFTFSILLLMVVQQQIAVLEFLQEKMSTCPPTPLSCFIFSRIISISSHLFQEVILESVKVSQSCPTLCDPMNYTVHGILQARILQWAAFPFSRGSSQPRDRTQVSHIASGFFTSWATREAPMVKKTTCQRRRHKRRGFHPWVGKIPWRRA